MWTKCIVFFAPNSRSLASFFKGLKVRGVEKFSPHAAIERFDKGVVGWFSGAREI
jgi:hypothetical protein